METPNEGGAGHPTPDNDQHTFTQEYLYAFATQGEIDNYLRTQALGLDRDAQADLLVQWVQLQPVVAELVGTEAGIAETISIEQASFKREQDNPATTEFLELADRGHAMVIDDNWQEVAETALKFAARFVS